MENAGKLTWIGNACCGHGTMNDVVNDFSNDDVVIDCGCVLSVFSISSVLNVIAPVRAIANVYDCGCAVD